MSGLAARLLQDLDRAGAGQGPQWLIDLRARGYRRFRDTGLPGNRVEEWKYTSLLALEKQVSPSAKASVKTRPSATAVPVIESVPCVSMSGGDFGGLEGECPAGVDVQPLRQVLDEQADVIRELLESLPIDQPRDGFSALNTASLGPGVVIRVAAGTDGGEILLQWDSSPGGEALMQSRVLLVLEPGASLHLVEQLENSSGDAMHLNQVILCQLAENASLDHSRLQQLSAGSAFISRTEVAQAAGSRYRFTALDMGDGLARQDVKASLEGKEAECELNGAVVARNRAHCDHHLEADHAAGHCRSSQLFRGVALDRGRVVFNGKVHVHPGADGTEAEQSSAGLLLSRQAEIDAKPELEIYADEVIASHGATVGQLDEKALFYLRSRGLGQAEASRILTMAFCRSVADRVQHPALRDTLGDRLSAALASGLNDD